MTKVIRMNNYKKILTVQSMNKKLLLLYLFVLFFLPARAWAHEDAVLLGINYPLTGPYSVEGLDQIRAARMAVDELNQNGGILGRRVVLKTRNSNSDEILTRINVKQLINEGCTMIFGGVSSDVAIAACEVCHANDVLFFGTLTYATATTLEHARSSCFRECNDSYMSAQVLGPWLNEHFQGKRYFYITADYTWGWNTEQSIREVTGTHDSDVHSRILMPLGSLDFYNALSRASISRADVLVLSLFGKDMAHALNQARIIGLDEVSQIVIPNLTLGMAERAGFSAMEGVLGTMPWNWKIPYIYGYSSGQKFVEEFKQRFRRRPSTSGASAYTIVHEYASAVERAGSFSSQDVIQALKDHRYSLLKGEQVWRALDHQSVQTVYLVKGNSPAQVLSDPLRQDFFTILDSRPGHEIVLPPEEWKARRVNKGLAPNIEGRQE